MIFHTSADKTYYENFFKSFSLSIKKNCIESKFSFNYVGDDFFSADKNIQYFSQDHISFEAIKSRYSDDERSAKGYYALSRWISIPCINEHIFVCDVDVMAVNPIDISLLNMLLNDYEIINLTRIKPKKNIEGGMMVMLLRSDVCEQVRSYSNQLLKTTTDLQWSTDINVRSYIYKNFKVKNLLQMENIGKGKSIKDIDKWFVYSKPNKYLLSIQT